MKVLGIALWVLRFAEWGGVLIKYYGEILSYPIPGATIRRGAA